MASFMKAVLLWSPFCDLQKRDVITGAGDLLSGWGWQQENQRQARLLNVLEGLRAGPTRVKVEALGDWMEGRVTELWMYTDKSSSFPFSVLCITHCAERAQSVLCVCRYPWEWDHVRLSPSRAPHTVPRAQEVLRRHLGDLWITSKEGVDRNKELWRACQHSNK